MVVDAYSYRIEYSYDCYWIFLNETLFGTIEKGKSGKWHINLDGQGKYFVLRRSGFFRTIINIDDIDGVESIAKINFPVFPSFFPKIKFRYKEQEKLYWASKNFFSVQWHWEQNNKIIIESIEDIIKGKTVGVIIMSSYDDHASLLIVTGVFLSLWRKRKLTLGLYGFHRKKNANDDSNDMKRSGYLSIPSFSKN